MPAGLQGVFGEGYATPEAMESQSTTVKQSDATSSGEEKGANLRRPFATILDIMVGLPIITVSEMMKSRDFLQ